MPLATDQHTRIPSGIVPLCLDTDDPLLRAENVQQDKVADGPILSGPALIAKLWTIYTLTHLVDGRIYVGLTQRSLIQRTRSHIQQAKRDRRIRKGGLMEVIQTTLVQGKTFAEAFQVEAVATAHSKAEAAALERAWVERLGSRYPRGLNGMPGGSSVGGAENARSLTVRLVGVTHRFASIGEAITWSNGRLQAQGRPAVDVGTVYARLAMKWPPAQALGLAPHRDGRRQRVPFIMDGKSYCTLAEASAKSGICVDTLRSRLHRQRVAGVRMDLSIDRRQALGPRGPRTPRQGLAEPRVPTDRRKLVVLTLPNGSRLIGGEREVIGKVLSDPQRESRRVEHLSASGIRRRLRLLESYDRLVGTAAVAWAFGFKAAPPPYVSAGKTLN